MRTPSLPRRLFWQGSVWLLLSFSATAAPLPQVLRWAEGNPGCTFTAGEDGKYRYGLWSDDFGVVMAVDAQELEKSRRRPERFLALFVLVRSRTTAPLTLDVSKITVEFSKHFKETENPLLPQALSEALGKDATADEQSAAREIQKHPERRPVLQARAEQRRQDIIEMQQFLKDHTLGNATLTGEHSETSGWIFFSARNQWIGDWKKQEQFVLRVPIGSTMVEFPFLLPPSRDDIRLRTRSPDGL